MPTCVRTCVDTRPPTPMLAQTQPQALTFSIHRTESQTHMCSHTRVLTHTVPGEPSALMEAIVFVGASRLVLCWEGQANRLVSRRASERDGVALRPCPLTDQVCASLGPQCGSLCHGRSG